MTWARSSAAWPVWWRGTSRARSADFTTAFLPPGLLAAVPALVFAAAARKFFMTPEAASREEWLPYMLAFGLYAHVPEALAVATFACGVGRPSRRRGEW